MCVLCCCSASSLVCRRQVRRRRKKLSTTTVTSTTSCRLPSTNFPPFLPRILFLKADLWFLCIRGVFQNMVERHFPAPNRKKTFDLLSMFDDDEGSSSGKKGQKRKKTFGKTFSNVQEWRIYREKVYTIKMFSRMFTLPHMTL